MLQKYKIPLVILGVALVAFLAYTVFATTKYRITGTTPNNRSYPSSLGVMDIYFNRKLDKQAINAVAAKEPGKIVKGSFEGGIRVIAYDDRLSLTFNRTPLAGKYEISLKDIRSTKGETFSANLPLIVKDIPYDKLSKEEKALFDKVAKDAGENDSVKFPLLSKLPYETDKYLINYRFAIGDPAPTVVITMKFFEPGSLAVPATPQETQAYQDDIRTYRTQALAWLRSQASDLETKYTLEYGETDLQEEFPKGRARYQNDKVNPADQEPAQSQ